jgi:RNA polymerase sigma factor (sigma-70 family)
MLSKKLLYLANSYYVDGYTTDDKVQSMRIKILAIIPKYSAEKSTFATYVERCLKNMIKDDIKHNSRAEKYITNYPLEKLGWYVSIDEKDR